MPASQEREQLDSIKAFPHIPTGLKFVLISIGLVVVGCAGSPNILGSGISGEVRTYKNWRVDWADSSLIANAKPAIADPNYTSRQLKFLQQGSQFLQELRNSLRDDYNFQFAENLPIDGRIVIRMLPKSRTMAGTVDSTAERAFESQSAAASPRASNPGAELGAVFAAIEVFSQLFGRKFSLAEANVAVCATDGRELGSFVIGGNKSSVKASHIAKSLNQLISTGRTK